MTTENISTEGSTQTNAEVTIDLPTALSKLQALEKDFVDAKESRDKVKEKLRKLEEDYTAVNEFKTKFETAETEKTTLQAELERINSEFNGFKEVVQQEKVSSLLNTAIEKAGAKSASTVLKLIDKSKIEFDEQGQVKAESITAVIGELKSSDPILFGETFIDPGVKLPGASNNENAYTLELRKATTPAEIEAVWKKHHLNT